ncbi:FAS1-like dehydratase domain-containing protein [Parahaliea mediterranea]|uniref:MaoC family dehydratase N-terminal domain-containing protein n=1 Tax=Parahaliea mediterranea TaxID=651086 RepID=A0A939IMG8_9GAMM|nr:MaoC family dehydratase N-terminal domain-containing protein [Parahaliea mediterranea]MBN7797505.1 MaoC family dehydratase N-terminal domain-containing protein [Parahaliea mediterranea]
MSEENKESNQGQITDEDISLQRELIGVDIANRGHEYHSQLSTDAIRNFALSIGDDNPLYSDSAYARKTRWGSVIAPSIMTAVVNKPLLGEGFPKELKKRTRGLFKGCQIFMSGGTWTWYRPMYPGDTIYSFEGEESVEVKSSEFGGRTVHIVRRYVKFNQRGDIVGIYRALRIMANRKAAREKGKYKDIQSASYAEDDIARIDAKYMAEKPRGSESRYWEDVGVGDTIEPIQKGPLTITDVILAHNAGYGLAPYRMLASGRVAAKDRAIMPTMYSPNAQGFPDTNARVHWDPVAATAVGNPDAYDWGLQREFWLHHLLTDWAGDDGFVLSQKDQIRKFNYMGDLQILTGKVVRKYEEDSQYLVDVSISATNQRGEETALADATISLPTKEGGPVVLPEPPRELKSKAIAFLAEHNRRVASS